ncbi:copper amine oxidase N-terminal domain-containing protein [Bacillus tuaregi]|uniref:copper amine oxidase N-terminal domain-containing protein n=1 Tax=Bacillus tuaregi TaxID=1816695 RepID=UPI0008F88468|nr:copper amine oxidase N-terminal domain-containing protein [Bacillus tuaregi]
MKWKGTKSTLSLIMLLCIFQSGSIALADGDDNHEEYERYEKHEYEKDDEDDDDKKYWEGEAEGDDNSDYYENDIRYESNPIQTHWNLWTREISSSTSNTELPFQEAKEVGIELNNKSELFYVIPQSGQLLVPGEKVAKFIGAKSSYYQQSKILELSMGKEELIVRAGTNAAYENMVKAPMPTKSFYYEKSVYLPISVIANGLGFRVNWDEGKSTIILQEI